MSSTARFDLPNFDDHDYDDSNCVNCPHANGRCFNAGYCIVEDELC